MEISVTGLINEIAVLDSLVAKYEEIKLNLFNQLKDSCNNWQDGYSLDFGIKIDQERHETDRLIQNLKNKRTLYTYICDSYSTFGKKVRCILDKKSLIINAIGSCQTQINSILQDFGNVDRSFYYSELSMIESQQMKVVKLQEEFKDIKSAVNTFFKDVEKIENKIKEKMKKMESFKVNNFDFSLN